MINERIKAERERLKLSQAEFAALAGAAKRTIANWESGQTSPTAVQLSELFNSGVDILYILTGERSKSENIENKTNSLDELNQEERVLLDNFRNISKEAQAALKATSDALAIRKDKKHSA